MKKLFVKTELWYILTDLFYHGSVKFVVVKFDKKRSISRYSFDFAHILPPFFEQLKCLQELPKNFPQAFIMIFAFV